VKIILDVPDRELQRALVEAIMKAEIRKLSIIIDGIDIIAQEEVAFVQNVYSLVRHTIHTVPQVKALLTSAQSSDLQNTLGRLPCIEYDKERKGFPIPCLSGLGLR
jgi:short-subunit dehydrogenase involved in D-alanine esterification of teichoic acids